MADKTRIVRDPNTGVTRQIIAGQPIPPDLVDAVEGPSVVEEGQETEKAKAQAAAEATERQTAVAPDLDSCTDEELDAYVKQANADDTVALAGDDREKAQRVLDSETRTHKTPRKGVVSDLQAVIDAD